MPPSFDSPNFYDPWEQQMTFNTHFSAHIEINFGDSMMKRHVICPLVQEQVENIKVASSWPHNVIFINSWLPRTSTRWKQQLHIFMFGKQSRIKDRVYKGFVEVLLNNQPSGPYLAGKRVSWMRYRKIGEQDTGMEVLEGIMWSKTCSVRELS